MSPSQPLKVDEKVAQTLKSGVSRIILTSVGDGPFRVNDHLVDERGQINGDIVCNECSFAVFTSFIDFSSRILNLLLFSLFLGLEYSSL